MEIGKNQKARQFIEGVMGAGRPTKYKKEYCQMLIDKMSEGFSVEAFCGSISINKDTFYEWVKRYPEFSDAKRQGLVKSQMWWEEQAKKHMFLPHQGGSFNSSVWIFNMKNRFGWRDQPKEEETKQTHEVHIKIDKDDSEL
jgi:hypothetical protein